MSAARPDVAVHPNKQKKIGKDTFFTSFFVFVHVAWPTPMPIAFYSFCTDRERTHPIPLFRNELPWFRSISFLDTTMICFCHGPFGRSFRCPYLILMFSISMAASRSTECIRFDCLFIFIEIFHCSVDVCDTNVSRNLSKRKFDVYRWVSCERQNPIKSKLNRVWTRSANETTVALAHKNTCRVHCKRIHRQ